MGDPKPRKTRAWLQYHLSSFVAASLVAAWVLYMNIVWEDKPLWNLHTDFLGWPFGGFRIYPGGDGPGYWEMTDSRAIWADILIGATLILGVLFGLEVLDYLRREKRAGLAKLWAAIRPSSLTWAILVTALLMLACANACQRVLPEHIWEFGWPLAFLETPSFSLRYRWIAWRALTVDIYAWAAILSLVWLVAECLLRRWTRGTTAGPSAKPPTA